jgi:hypothetical protein
MRRWQKRCEQQGHQGLLDRLRDARAAEEVLGFNRRLSKRKPRP